MACGLWLRIGQHSLRTLTNPPGRFFSKSHTKLSSRSEAPVSLADPLGNAAKSPALSQISQSWPWVETPCVSQQGEHRLTFTDSYPLRSQPLTYFTSICCHWCSASWEITQYIATACLWGIVLTSQHILRPRGGRLWTGRMYQRVIQEQRFSNTTPLHAPTPAPPQGVGAPSLCWFFHSSLHSSTISTYPFCPKWSTEH